jgi:hypothetical protein
MLKRAGVTGVRASPFGHKVAEAWGTGRPSVRPSFRSFCAATAEAVPKGGISYAAFAKEFPFANNVIIATLKTSAADLVAQCVIEQKSIFDVDWKRNAVFCLFGAAYLGGFQYFYQVNVFKRIFSDAERFTKLPWAAKLSDTKGLGQLAGQIVADLTVMVFVYLPTFYVFKGFVFGSTWSPQDWVSDGLGNYTKNWNKDVYDVLRVWGPTDVVCFSVPMYLRLPVRHIVSFIWTAYLSFMRGGKGK